MWRPPSTNNRQALAAVVMEQLGEQLGSPAFPRLSVLTSVGVRVPEVSWLPSKRWAEALKDGPLEVVPPVVVEVLSTYDHPAATAHKVSAYLAGGATEVAVIGLTGVVRYHREDGEHSISATGLELRLDSVLAA